MSKAEILDQLPKLGLEDRREILERICELDGSTMSASEKEFLDQRLAECRGDKVAWSTWDEAKARIVSRLPKS
jgi:hypothetical protein